MAQFCQVTNDDARKLEYEDTSSEKYEETNLLDEVNIYFDISKLLELVSREIGAPKASSEEPPNLELKQLPSQLRYVPTSKVKGATEPKHYWGSEFDQSKAEQEHVVGKRGRGLSAKLIARTSSPSSLNQDSSFLHQRSMATTSTPNKVFFNEEIHMKYDEQFASRSLIFKTSFDTKNEPNVDFTPEFMLVHNVSKLDSDKALAVKRTLIMTTTGRQLTEVESKDKGKGKVKETTPKPRVVSDLYANRFVGIASKNHSKPRGYLTKVGKNGDQEHYALHYLHNWNIALRETLLSLSPGVMPVFPIFPVDLFAERTVKPANPTAILPPHQMSPMLGQMAYINAQRKNKIVDPTKDPCTKIRSERKR
ncbi:hypothetical protein V6N11_058418 [Hibiscus sabdariffa]|uniref:Uncharacterized protein n=1 Tax=Hibiscus sabdariffa TaxID=183260 RepID=A0ABR2U477_9ROSI